MISIGQKPYGGFLVSVNQNRTAHEHYQNAVPRLRNNIAMSHQIVKEGYICIKIRQINIYFVSLIRIS